MKFRSGSFVCILNIWRVVMAMFLLEQTSAQIPPTVFTQQPQGGLPESIGNRKVLMCLANGSPNPVYQWTKNGVPLSQNISDISFQIRSIQLSDTGIYQCIASNNLGSLLSNHATVTVAYMVRYNTSGDVTVVTVSESRAAIITLPLLDCVPAPAILWKDGSDNIISGESQRYHLTLNSQLVLLETRILADNNKTFMATATNSFVQQTTESATYLLNVQSNGDSLADIMPEIVLPPHPTSAVQGDDSVKLECVANARPLNFLSLNWYRKIDGNQRQIIQPDNLKYMLSMYRRVLTIRNLMPSDAGIYLCEASFIRPGSASPPQPAVAEANLTVYVKPSFVSIPKSEYDLDVGSSETLQCQALGIPLPMVRWYRNSQLINSTLSTRYQMTNSGDLVLHNLTTSDSGVFQCFVLNSAGEMSAATWVKISTYEPEILKPPKNLSVISGESARFSCETSGAPKPVISWSQITLIGIITDPLVSTSHFQVLDNELLIPVTEVDDAGIYICNATNTEGSTSAEAFLTVTIRTRIVLPPQNLSIIKGSVAVFQCGVTNDPSVKVTWHWFHNNAEILLPDTRQNIRVDGSLEIRAVRNSDIGMYTCMVVSNGGNDSTSADLKVIELPYPPEITSVQLNPSSNSSVDIAWKPGFDGLSPIKSFTLRYRIIASSTSDLWVVITSSISSNQYTYTVVSLKPAKSYQFTITAVNDVGESQPSTPSAIIALPQQPPSGPPRSFIGSPRSNSSILLQWQAPDPDLINGNLLGYMVRYKPSGYPDSTLSAENITTFQDSVMCELTGLIVFQEYEISVAAYNAKGVGVYSGSLFIRTFEGVPTLPPTLLTVSAVNSTALNVSWLPPNPQYINGINQGYKVYAQELNGSRLSLVVPSLTNNMLGSQTVCLTHLRKFVLYFVTVLCFTSQGDGPLSSALSAQTLEDIPDPVSNLSFTNIMDTSLTVIWSPPTHSNGILTGYSVTYMRKGLNDTRVMVQLNATTLNYTIIGLAPTTVYTISVWASSRIGPGKPQSADIPSGITPILPSPPTGLTVKNIEARSVLLQFVPGFNGYTSIIRWIIEGQMNDRVSTDSWITVYSVNDPDATFLTVFGLTPYSRYRLRIIAENIAGRSNASDPTSWFSTQQAVPSIPPGDVKVRALNATSIRVWWSVLPLSQWNGNNRGYLVQWKPKVNVNFSQSVTIMDENFNTYQLNGLRKWTRYDIRVAAINNIGIGDFSSTFTEQTLESTPTSGPADVMAVAITSTSIQVSWSNVSEDSQNGMILGYKVIYTLSTGASTRRVQTVSGNATMNVNITHLHKFSWYFIQVLAYTGIGDGVPCDPPISVLTLEDVPGPPTGVYFPQVTETTATLVWSPPQDPNGNLTGYRMAFGLQASPQTFPFSNDRLAVTDLSYHVSNLTRQSFYVFVVTARTRLGWGQAVQLSVFTINRRTIPESPNTPFISQVGDRWAVINFMPRGDGYGPIRNFSLELQLNEGPFLQLDDYIDANVTDYNVSDLKPNSLYRFRVAAWNDVGISNYSNMSEQVRTDRAAPESAPSKISIVTLTPMSMRVNWEPPPEASWNGDLIGFDVAYREGNSGDVWKIKTVGDPSQYYADIGNVQLFTVYEVKVRTFNDKGYSDYSPVVTIFLEIAPTGPVLSAGLLNVTSTTILVSWQPPLADQWNGNILGYKIFYWETQFMGNGSDVLIVQHPETELELSGLQPFTNYSLTLLAFNMAGDGPNMTKPLEVMTKEDLPGPPGLLQFMVPSPTSLNVSWTSPSYPNGIITMYEVSFYQDFQLDGINKSVQVQLLPDKTSYFTQQLIEAMTYVFGVRARTSLGWGQPSVSSVTMGPQPGSPGSPEKPSCTVGDKSITVTWVYGNSGDSPITGCLVQAQERSAISWETKVTSMTPITTTAVSFLTVKQTTDYHFRVIAINRHGIGLPSEASEYVRSIDVLEAQKPFYQQWWFLVIVALVGVIVIILVVSCLAITGRRYRVRHRTANNKSLNSLPRSSSIPIKHIHSNVGLNTDDDDNFVVFDVQQQSRNSQRQILRIQNASNSRVNLPSRSSRHTPHPPRPSPGRVDYNCEDDGKSVGSSSLSEKASDVSAVRSHASDSDEDIEKSSPPPAFANHYVSGTVKNSLNRNKLPVNPYNYADSEQSSSHYGFSLNGGQLMINNVAGSRAPLPSFSSFV